jgi:hypothetical protein
MRRFGAFVGVVATLIALLTSPFYHFHDRDDHGRPAPLVHAHLLEGEESAHHSNDEAETANSHEHARWIEFFVFAGPSPFLDLEIELTEVTPLAPALERHTVVIAAVPNAHGPPGERLSIPRSPPTV